MVPLRTLREAYGLTLSALAARIAEFGVTVDPDSLSAVELGHTGASKQLLTAWACALNILPIDIRLPKDLRVLLLEDTSAPERKTA